MMRVASFSDQGPIVGHQEDRSAVAEQEILRARRWFSMSRWSVGSSSRRISGLRTRAGPRARGASCRSRARHGGVGIERHPREHRLDLLVYRPAAVDPKACWARSSRACNSAPPWIDNSCATRWYSANNSAQRPGRGPLRQNGALEPLGHLLRENGSDESLPLGNVALRRSISP